MKANVQLYALAIFIHCKRGWGLGKLQIRLGIVAKKDLPRVAQSVHWQVYLPDDRVFIVGTASRPALGHTQLS